MVAAVTGATGHIGTNLVRALVATGRPVVAIDMREPVDALEAGASWARADVRDATAMRSALSGVDVVFHLAAVISVTGAMSGLVQSVNVSGVKTTAEAALSVGVRRFVHCSSVHAFDLMACRGRRVTEDSPRSGNPRLPIYDLTKAAGEQELRRVVAAGLDATIVNPSGVIGPQDLAPSRMGAVLLAAARGRLPATIHGSFDWVDVRDVVDGLLSAERAGETGCNYLLGGHSATLAELAEMAAQVTGARRPVADLPMWFARLWAPGATVLARYTHNPLLYAADSLHAMHSQPDIDHRRAASVLGHRPRPLEETVRDLVDSFVARRLL